MVMPKKPSEGVLTKEHLRLWREHTLAEMWKTRDKLLRELKQSRKRARSLLTMTQQSAKRLAINQPPTTGHIELTDEFVEALIEALQSDGRVRDVIRTMVREEMHKVVTQPIESPYRRTIQDIAKR
jgi:hypothetical protein